MPRAPWMFSILCFFVSLLLLPPRAPEYPANFSVVFQAPSRPHLFHQVTLGGSAAQTGLANRRRDSGGEWVSHGWKVTRKDFSSWLSEATLCLKLAARSQQRLGSLDSPRVREVRKWRWMNCEQPEEGEGVVRERRAAEGYKVKQFGDPGLGLRPG